jgi:hypothetical protein
MNSSTVAKDAHYITALLCFRTTPGAEAAADDEVRFKA